MTCRQFAKQADSFVRLGPQAKPKDLATDLIRMIM